MTCESILDFWKKQNIKNAEQTSHNSILVRKG